MPYTNVMRSVTAAVLCIVISYAAAAEAADLGGLKIVPERVPPWNPGIPGGIPDVPVKADVTRYGAVADMKTDCSPAFQRAIDWVKPPGAVLVPAGRYLLRKTLELRPGVVLRGEGQDKTLLHFVYNRKHNESWRYPAAIVIAPPKAPDDPRFIEPYRDIDTHLEDQYTVGSTELVSFTASSLKPGQYVAIVCNNAPTVHNSTQEWLEKSWYNDVNIIGQVLRVKGVDGKQIVVDRPLYLTYPAKMMPRLRPVDMIERCGVEKLHITNKKCGHLIDIKYAAECWVADCHLEYSYRSHVSVMASRGVVVRDSYMHHGHGYDGGEAYGVWLGHWSTDCLVENNVFDHLRHSMVTTLGACGNVFGYNLSARPQHSDKADDICQHGFYSYANLFEGNVAIQAVYADYWGPIGPRNTCYRNRFTKGVLVRDKSHNANILGNTFMGGDVTVEKDCRDAWIEKNLFVLTKENPKPKGVDGLAGNLEGEVLNISQTPDWKIPASLYLKKQPNFWQDKPWPGIGAEMDLERVRARIPMISIPAEERYQKLLKK